MNTTNNNQLALVEQLTTLNQTLDKFINGEAKETVPTRAGVIKTLSGIVNDLTTFRYVQKIIDHRLYSDMIADNANIDIGILIRVFGDTDWINGIYKKNGDMAYSKVAYADLYDIIPPLPGTSGDSTGTAPNTTLNNVIQKEAAANLSGHRVVLIDTNNKVNYAGSDMQTFGLRILGVTTSSSMMGDLATIQTFGEMVEPSWNWDVTKAIYLGLDGYLTQTPPTSGFVLVMGIPSSATSMIINIRDLIVLS